MSRFAPVAPLLGVTLIDDRGPQEPDQTSEEELGTGAALLLLATALVLLALGVIVLAHGG
jgi:hypothetical protein